MTGFDSPGVLHGFFGDDWSFGIGPLHKQERRNYLFALKSPGGWTDIKKHYDMLPLETVPFFRATQGTVEPNLSQEEKNWVSAVYK